MKMKVQKVNFKKVVLLLLLLSGSLNFSFSVANAAVMVEGQELSVTAEFNEQLQDMREGSLPAVLSLQLFKTNPAFALSPYYYLSSEEAVSSSVYIRSCRKIDPALGITEIIYPFHSFL